MKCVSKTVYDVQHARNSGSPTSREAYGDGAFVVLSERESRLHGEGKQTGQMEGKKEMEGCVMLPMKSLSTSIRNILKPVGEPDAEKLARPVRGGDVGKGQQCTSLASYSTQKGGGENWGAPCHALREFPPKRRAEASCPMPQSSSTRPDAERPRGK
jgi:hypothetical protein